MSFLQELAGTTDLNTAIFQAQNQLRTKPSSFIPIVQDKLNHIDANGVIRYPGKTGMRTKEGKAPYLEAIAFLKKQKPVGALKNSAGLMKACRDHVLDQGPKGTTGHTGSDGSSPFVRMNRYGQW